MVFIVSITVIVIYKDNSVNFFFIYIVSKSKWKKINVKADIKGVKV